MENTQNFKTTVLNKLKLRFNYSITKENFNNEIYMNVFSNQIVADITYKVLGNNIIKKYDVEYEITKNFFQHL